MSARANAPSHFLNGPNYTKIVGFLRQHYASKLGTNAISPRVDTRLQKTVQHYMTAIANAHGNKPIQTLNNEVLRETALSMDSWMQKQEAPVTPTTTSVGMFTKQEDDSRLFMDTGTRYDALIAERAPPVQDVLPVMPDFRSPADTLMVEEDPVILMQRLQKQRDDQSRGLGLAGPPPRLEIREEALPPSATAPIPPQADSPPPLLAPRPQEYIIPQEDIVKYSETEHNIFLTSSDRDWLRNTNENRYNFSVLFNTGTKKVGYSYNAALQNRFRNIQRIEFVKAIVPTEALTPLIRVFFPQIGCAMPIIDNSRIINIFALPFAGIRIAELNNNGFSTNPEEDNTFAVVQYDTTWSSDFISVSDSLTYQTQLSNNIGHVLTKSGYTGLIPKFLRTQKVYTPTPLANINRLSIRMERHDSELLSTESDVQFISRVALSDSLFQGAVSPFTGLANFGVDNTLYYGQAGRLGTLYGPTSPCPSPHMHIKNPFIVIKTTTYFMYSGVGEGDLIQIKGFTVSPGVPVDGSTAEDFEAFMNRDKGHYVCGVGYSDVPNVAGCTDNDIITCTDYPQLNGGRNAAGYCNLIVIQNRFNNPHINDPAINFARTNSYFGGTTATEDTLVERLNTQVNSFGTGLINMSRQTHVVLRVITRDVDSSSNIRPDNV